MNKRGIELSVNFIIIMIIGIILLGMGIYLATKIIGSAEKQRLVLDQQTESQLNSLLASGKQVAIPINKKTIEDDSVVFGLGILNTVAEGTFIVSVDNCQPVDPTSNICENAYYDIVWPDRFQGLGEMITKDEKAMIPIAFTNKGLAKGQYSFDVEVMFTPSGGVERQYGPTNKIFITVP